MDIDKLKVIYADVSGYTCETSTNTKVRMLEDGTVINTTTVTKTESYKLNKESKKKYDRDKDGYILINENSNVYNNIITKDDKESHSTPVFNRFGVDVDKIDEEKHKKDKKHKDETYVMTEDDIDDYQEDSVIIIPRNNIIRLKGA